MAESKTAKPVILSGFADEITASKDLDQQFSVVAALGMEFFSIRFVRVGNEIKNAVNLAPDELQQVRQKMSEYGLRVSSLGSPIGKVKLCDIDDGTQNQFVDFDVYCDQLVKPACQIACELSTGFVRGFSFYHPKDSDVSDHLNLATDRIGKIVEICSEFDLIYGLEVEANLVGHRGAILADIHAAINHPSLVLVFDGGNLVTQGFSSQQVFEQYLQMKPGLGWIHVKDYLPRIHAEVGEYVDEESLDQFVPVEQGASGYARILQDLADHGQEVFARVEQMGAPGLFLDLEPHLKGGGQFGGNSGADGYGLAFRSLCRQLDNAQLNYQLRDLSKIKSLV